MVFKLKIKTYILCGSLFLCFILTSFLALGEVLPSDKTINPQQLQPLTDNTLLIAISAEESFDKQLKALKYAQKDMNNFVSALLPDLRH